MSHTFYVTNEALICLNPDTASESADATEVMIHYCPIVPTTGPDVNNCMDILDAPLDGTIGADDTQNACIRVARGSYWIEVTTPPAASDNAVISVFGE
jgi:hypothetical protein